MFKCNDLLNPQYVSVPKGIVFDCDGVLFDSHQANSIFYNTIRQDLGLPRLSRDEEDYVHFASVGKSLEYIIPAERMGEARAAARRIDYRKLLPYMIPFDGIYELLAWLKGVGIRCAVNTNRTNTMHLVLETYDMSQYFQPVIQTSMVSRAKPHPEGLNRILAAWGLDRREVAFIGDSDPDQQAGQAAGVKFWAFGTENLPAEMWIESYWDLARWLKRNLGTANGRKA